MGGLWKGMNDVGGDDGWAGERGLRVVVRVGIRVVVLFASVYFLS